MFQVPKYCCVRLSYCRRYHLVWLDVNICIEISITEKDKQLYTIATNFVKYVLFFKWPICLLRARDVYINRPKSDKFKHQSTSLFII